MSDNEGSDSETKKAKGTKRKAKKGGPKRPLSAYMFYCQANRDQVKKDNPEIAFTEVAKVLGGKWNELTESEKKPFEKQHAADKVRYEKEKAEHPGDDDDGGGKKKKTKTGGKKKKEGPKKPLTAFMCFSQEERKRMKEAGDKADFGETGKIIGGRWKQLSDSEKAPYNEMAEKNKAVYEDAVKEWEKTHGPLPKKASKPKKSKKKDDDDDGGDEEADD